MKIKKKEGNLEKEIEDQKEKKNLQREYEVRRKEKKF